MDGRPTSLDNLATMLQKDSRDVPVLIRADREVTLQGFVDVIDLLKRMNFKKVSLQTVVLQ